MDAFTRSWLTNIVQDQIMNGKTHQIVDEWLKKNNITLSTPQERNALKYLTLLNTSLPPDTVKAVLAAPHPNYLKKLVKNIITSHI